MAIKITMQQYDNLPQIIFTIKTDGVAEPLIDAKVLVKFRNKATGFEFDKYATITDANNGECELIMTREDLSVVGSYITEVETTYSNGTVLSAYNPFILIVQQEVHNPTKH